jgi:prophage tail gpP-like protein
MPNPTPGQNYAVVSGDVLNRIASVAYGLASKWPAIVAANPQLNGRGKASDGSPLIFPGDILYIPPDAEKQQAMAEARENRFKDRPKEKITLVIYDKDGSGRELPVKQGRFAYGIDVLAPSYNAEIAWTPGKDEWLDRVTARGSFAKSELYIGAELVCTGRLYTRENIITKDSITKNLEFYSVTADIVDSHIPPAFSEIKDSNLKQIAEKLLSSHGFQVTFKDPPGNAFDVVERSGVETVAKYLQRLAAQRGLFVSCDERGGVVFQKAANTGTPVARIEYPGRVAAEFKAKFDDRLRFAKYFASSIAGDGIALNATASDPGVPAARQLLFEANDADAATIKDAAEWRMLRIELEALSVSFPVTDWFDGNSKLWRPNTIVTVKSPVLDIPDERNYVIKNVEFAWTANERSALLTLVPPLTVDGGGKLKVGTK